MLHFGIRDQNLELNIGISDEKIYLVTTLSNQPVNKEVSKKNRKSGIWNAKDQSPEFLFNVPPLREQRKVKTAA